VLGFATINGASANHLDRKIGTLTPGKEADIILLRSDAINVAPMNNAYSAVVQAMDTSNVDTVIIAGQIRKRQGQLIGVDLTRLRQQAQASRDYIAQRAGWSSSRLGRS
jgi:cytosine/adenosine deaminase-related metal-dependent hydrolase